MHVACGRGLGHSMTALRYVIYFRLYEWRNVLIPWDVPVGRIKHDVMFRRVGQVAVPVGRQTIVLGRVRQNVAPG